MTTTNDACFPLGNVAANKEGRAHPAPSSTTNRENQLRERCGRALDLNLFDFRRRSDPFRWIQLTKSKERIVRLPSQLLPENFRVTRSPLERATSFTYLALLQSYVSPSTISQSKNNYRSSRCKTYLWNDAQFQPSVVHVPIVLLSFSPEKP